MVELCHEPRVSYRAKSVELKNQFQNLVQASRKNLSKKMHSSGFKSLKDLTVDFACREDLAITSLKEFLEVFV